MSNPITVQLVSSEQETLNPLSYVESKFNKDELEKAFIQWSDKVPEDKKERDQLAKTIRSIGSMKKKIEDARMEIARPVNAKLKELKSHADQLKTPIEKAVDKLKSNLDQYDKAEELKAKKLIDDACQKIDDDLQPYVEEIDTSKFIDDIQFISEKVTAYEVDSEDPTVTQHLLGRKNYLLGKLMKRQQELMNPAPQKTNVRASVAMPDDEIVIAPQNSDSDDQPNTFEELYAFYALGRTAQYREKLNKLERNQIYEYLRYVVKANPKIDALTVADLVRVYH